MIDHANEAEQLLAQWDPAIPASEVALAEAQVHATLAVARRLDSLLALLERGR